MKCRKCIRDNDYNPDHYNVVRYGSYGLQNPLAIIFKLQEDDAIPETKVVDKIITNDVGESGVELGNITIKNIDIKNKKLTYKFKENPSHIKWKESEIGRPIGSNTSGQFIWTDGENVYYSYYLGSNNIQQILDKSTNKWKYYNWQGMTSFSAFDIWTDGINIYCSTKILDKENHRWLNKTWEGLNDFSGRYVWTDGSDIYYSTISSNPSPQYKLDKETSTWNPITWNGEFTRPDGLYIWNDGKNAYYSNGTKQYVLDKESNTWNVKDWKGLTNFKATYIWKNEEGEIYYSYNSIQYKLDKETSTWNLIKWDAPSYVNYKYVWSDGDNIYYSEKEGNYILDRTTNEWIPKIWYGITDYTNFYGSYIFSDGENVYFSRSNISMILNKSNDTWEELSRQVTNGVNSELNVWNDGENIYYSYSSTQRKFNKTYGTWSNKTWNGLSDFDGKYVWSDGDNIYYSYGNNQYVLDRETSTWNAKTWYGVEKPNGSYIWADENNIYYSYGNNQYVLVKEQSTWIEYGWYGLSRITGDHVIENQSKTNIYYVGTLEGYKVLDIPNSTWMPVEFKGIITINGNNIWNYNNKTYYTGYNQQLELNSKEKLSQKIITCYYNNKDSYTNNSTNITRELYLEEPEKYNQEDLYTSFDILMMAKRWKEDLSSYAEKQEGTASSLTQRLSVIQGELWYKINYGLPLFQNIRDKGIMDSVIIDIILSHPDVASIETYKSRIEKDGNYYFEGAKIITIFNETIELSKVMG